MKLSANFVEDFGKNLDSIVDLQKYPKTNTALKIVACELAGQDMFLTEKMREFSDAGKALLQYDDKAIPKPHQSVKSPLVHMQMLQTYLDKRFLYHGIMRSFNNCLFTELLACHAQCTEAVTLQIEKSRRTGICDASYHEADFALRVLIAEKNAFLREQPLYLYDDAQTRQIMLQKDVVARRYLDGQGPV